MQITAAVRCIYGDQTDRDTLSRNEQFLAAKRYTKWSEVQIHRAEVNLLEMLTKCKSLTTCKKIAQSFFFGGVWNIKPADKQLQRSYKIIHKRVYRLYEMHTSLNVVCMNREWDKERLIK